MKRAVIALNEKEQARPPLDSLLRAELAQKLAPDVARLSSLLDRDLLGLWNFPHTDAANPSGSRVGSTSGAHAREKSAQQEPFSS
jgi:hypothetical protein